MRILAKNGDYTLAYYPERVNRYVVYKDVLMGKMKFWQTIIQSSNFTQKIKSYFTNQQINTAIAKVHAMKYVNRRFKA